MPASSFLTLFLLSSATAMLSALIDPPCWCSRSSESELARVLVLACDDGSVSLIACWSHWSADGRLEQSEHCVTQEMYRP